jgi:ribosomal protein L20A (L18A)
MPLKKRTPKKGGLTPTEQAARFREAAKQAEADERPEAFDKAFANLVPAHKAKKRKIS